MIASVLTPTLLYVLVMLVSTGVLPIPVLADSRIPVADVARRYRPRSLVDALVERLQALLDAAA